MFTRKAMAVSVLYLLTAQIVMADDNPQLGENVSQADLAVVDYTIMPNPLRKGRRSTRIIAWLVTVLVAKTG